MVQWILLMPQVRAQQIGCAQAINGDFCGHSLHASLLLPLAINAWLCGLSHGLRSTARLQNATPAQTSSLVRRQRKRAAPRQPSSNQDRWRLTPDAITSLRKAANARGRGLAAAGVVTPPDALCRVPLTSNDECAEPGVTADDEAKLLRWYEKQIPLLVGCLLYTSPSPRDATLSRMPSSA